MNENHRLPTSEQVDQRLRLVSELRNLCLSLGRARRVEPPTAPPTAPAAVDASAPATHSGPSADG
jgi:hypothetical protein